MLTSLERLEKEKSFQEWKEQNKEFYLASCFALIKDKKEPLWQFHFYNPKIDKIATFKVGKKIKQEKNEEIFKKEQETVEKLEMDKVKITFEQTLDIINGIERYKNQEFTKKIIILQNQKLLIWNISFLTKTFQILHIKIDAISGKILHESFESLMSLKK